MTSATHVPQPDAHGAQRTRTASRALTARYTMSWTLGRQGSRFRCRSRTAITTATAESSRSTWVRSRTHTKLRPENPSR